jgi:hypothetical protein
MTQPIFTLNLENPPSYFFDFNQLFQACYDVITDNQVRLGSKFRILYANILGLSSCPLTVTECANRILFKFTWVSELRDPEDGLNESSTIKTEENSMFSQINYWTEDIQKCPEIICSRFFHEATHAIRWIQALATGIFIDSF